ncbi:hypothetical protein [Tahibacter amnicola]|uniref:Uncharacterized protein n=1 Tax=Tahibacter amnicola TaxID=2976241 RepID=A0ABY6BAQ3_9GAMM|nr:hypothetical protein [Tahibacter amnicola]UXI66230.1 hypothetical protein N4264_15895 [Tahibacter amnicola]
MKAWLVTVVAGLGTAATLSATAADLRCDLLIDRSGKACSTFMCNPDGTRPESVGANADGSKPDFRSRADLVAAVNEEIRQRVKRDDYPEARLAERLPAWLKSNGGVPVGLCWNGGLAVTYGDYRTAERRLDEWQNDPGSARRPAPAADALNPMHSLGSSR